MEIFARKNKIRYTRYADDITFSTKQEFSTNVCFIEEGILTLGSDLETIIQRNSFVINHEKIHLKYKNTRQEVTGLVVNKQINVKREYIKEVRARLYKCRVCIDKGQKINPKEINSICGKLNYLKMIRGNDDTYFTKYALEFNEIFGETFSKIEHDNNFERWLEKRIFAIDTLEAGKDANGKIVYEPGFGSGTCFLINDIGVISCYHVMENILFSGSHEIILYNSTCLSQTYQFNSDS